MYRHVRCEVWERGWVRDEWRKGRAGVGFMGDCPLHPDICPIKHSHTTYHSLHHLHPLPPDLVDNFRYADRVFFFYLLYNMADCDEGASTTNSSTEGRERRGECHTLPWTLTLTCSGPPWGPWRTCALSSLSCGRLGWVWHSRALHGQARP